MVQDRSLDEVAWMIHTILGSSLRRKECGSSTDVYWTISNPDVPADFIRVRDLGGSHQITVKGKDRGINENRLEIDVDTDTSLPKVLKLVQSAFGKPAGEVTKEYHVFWPSSNSHVTLSTYKVMGDSRVFVEIEAPTQSLLEEWEDNIVHSFNRISRAPGSLYEMFITRTAVIDGELLQQRTEVVK